MLRKKFIAALLAIAFCCQLSIPVSAADELEKMPVTEIFCQEQVLGAAFNEADRHVLLIDLSASGHGMINGQSINEPDIFESINNDGHLLYPVRSISQYLGFTVDWKADAQTVTLQNESGREVVFTIGEPTAMVNGSQQPISTAPVIFNDKLMLPVRALIETLGGYVDYNEEGVLTLIDKATNFTAAEKEALALMQQVILQSGNDQKRLSDTVQLTRIDDKTYYRIGQNGFYVEQNGIKSPIDLGKKVHYILGIDQEMVYYIIGSSNKEGQFIDGHLCRADLTGGGQQILADYDDFTLSTVPKDNWHHDLPTYFFHGDGYDYIMVYGSTSRHGGYYLYKLQEQQAVIKYYFDDSSDDWLLSNNRLYFIWHSMGVPWGLPYIQLNADPVYPVGKGFPDFILRDYRFMRIFPLSENRMLALVECDAIPSSSGYVHPDPAKYAFCLIDTNTLNEKILRTSVPPNCSITIIDAENVLYVNQDGELCRIVLPKI